jgi:hypothetical protein
MSNGVIVQYLGFESKPQVREYTFHVREAGIGREFTLKIANEAFVTHRARYQDAPAICALRLNAELAAHSNHPAKSQFAITDPELDNYRESHTPKTQSSLFTWKKTQDDF